MIGSLSHCCKFVNFSNNAPTANPPHFSSFRRFHSNPILKTNFNPSIPYVFKILKNLQPFQEEITYLVKKINYIEKCQRNIPSSIIYNVFKTGIIAKRVDLVSNSLSVAMEQGGCIEDSIFKSLVDDLTKCHIKIHIDKEKFILNASAEFSEGQVQCIKKLNQIFPVNGLILENHKNLDALLEMSKEIDLHFLRIKGEDLDDHYFSELLTRLSCIKHLEIEASGITKVPSITNAQLRKLIFRQCNNLIHANLNYSGMTEWHECQNLQSLIANDVSAISVFNCPQVSLIGVLNTRFLCLMNCEQVISVLANHCETAVINSCLRLPQIHLPNAERVICEENEGLTEIIAELAMTIECRFCPQLKSIQTHRAQYIDASGSDQIEQWGNSTRTKISISPTSLFAQHQYVNQFFKENQGVYDPSGI